MKAHVKEQLLDELCTIVNYMLSADLYHPALVIAGNMGCVPCSPKMRQRIRETEEDVRRLAASRSVEMETEVEIPDTFRTDEEKLLWLLSQSISNLFQYGVYEMAYLFLMETSQIWTAVYPMVIRHIQGMQGRQEIVSWCLMHAVMAADITGRKEMDFADYRILLQETDPE